MRKTTIGIVTVLAVSLSLSAFAAKKKHTIHRKPADATDNAPIKCGSSVDEVVKQVSNAGSCDAAATVASTCAWGSSADSQIAGAASEVCAKEFPKLSDSDKKLQKQMHDRCADAFADKQGTMYISMAAFCGLRTAQYFASLNSGDDSGITPVGGDK